MQPAVEYAPAAVSQNEHAAWAPDASGRVTGGMVNRTGLLALATSMGLPSGLLNASRVMPPTVATAEPPGGAWRRRRRPVALPEAAGECGLKVSARKVATTGVVDGSSPSGMGWNADSAPGADSTAGGEPGGDSWTRDWMLAELMVTEMGARRAEALALRTSASACPVCRLSTTRVMAPSAAGSTAEAEEVMLESASTRRVPVPLVRFTGRSDTVFSTLSADPMALELSTTPGAADTTAPTAAAAAAGLAVAFWAARPASRLLCTAATCTSAAPLLVADADAASSVSALATLCTAPLEALTGAAEMLLSTLSAAACESCDSTAPPVPTDSTASTTDADADGLEVTLDAAKLLSSAF